MNINYNTMKQIAINTTQGRIMASQSTVVICTMVKNAEEYISNMFDKLVDLGEHFLNYYIIIYENDSTDDTVKILKGLESNHRSALTVISEVLDLPNLGGGCDSKRLETMAILRNKYLNEVKDKWSHYDYTIVVDGDIDFFDISGIMNSLGVPTEWDAITSNGLDILRDTTIYYDILTLVQHGKMQNNTVKAVLEYPSNTLIPVESAFGGLAIYKTQAILDAEYASFLIDGEHCGWHPDRRPCCEHTGLCLRMIENGFDKIFINPNQVVFRT